MLGWVSILVILLGVAAVYMMMKKQEPIMHENDVSEALKNNKVVVYVKSGCKRCESIRKELAGYDVEWINCDGGCPGVNASALPMIVINNQKYSGYHTRPQFERILMARQVKGEYKH